jgi:CRISPR type IV-associated protein Csf1
MTASELFCHQAGLSPKGAIARTVEICVMCGRLISPGEARSEFRPLPSFMDAPELCARDRSTKICGYCVHLTKMTVILQTQRVCITSKQLIPAARLAHVKWLLLNPPEPPFLLLQNQNKLSHMIWRTPLTLSRELWYVRMGAKLLMVRLALVAKALNRFRYISDRIDGLKANQRLRHPFNLLDCELRNLSSWRIRRDVGPRLLIEDQELIAMLRPGEYWALAILTTKQEPEDPNECRNIKLQAS